MQSGSSAFCRGAAHVHELVTLFAFPLGLFKLVHRGVGGVAPCYAIHNTLMELEVQVKACLHSRTHLFDVCCFAVNATALRNFGLTAGITGIDLRPV